MTTSGNAEGRGGRRFVPVAEVGRAHGIRGEVRLKLYHEGSELLTQRPTLKLRLPDGSEQPAKIVSARSANKAMLARLEGIDDRNAAASKAGLRAHLDILD